ncbi:MAG: radical SAM protein [Candidatus Omnitrophica bacterium]|nr:radical SAM protein [Candidatus Omnitrophota bacterium]MCM8801670.1 radical SAM protein [Candidatus Omnitrophota bacterium]
MNPITFEDLQAPLFVAWQINSACNLECLHCCEEAGHRIPGELNKQEVFHFLQQIVELNIPYVAISGGEPFLHPHFFTICEFLSKHNISIKVETNGEFIDEEKAKKIAQLRFRSVQISLDGATASTHERLRLRGDWNKAVSACRLLIKKGVNTEIVFVPTKFNIQEIGQLIDLAYSLGVYGIYTGKIMRIGRAAKNWDILCPSEKDYESFFKTLNDKVDYYDGKMKVYYYPYDVIEELKYRLKFPAASLLVLPNGKVKLIGPLPFICGDLKKQSLTEVWQNYKRAWRNPKVIEFAQRVIANPKLLAESNRWRKV